MSISFGSGKKKGKTAATRTIPKAGAQEQEVQGLNLDIARQVLDSILGQGSFNKFLLSQAQESFSPEAIASGEQRTSQAGQLTPEEEALIDLQRDEGLRLGESDIKSFFEEGLGFLRQELAPSRGLRPSDTPIVDRGGLLLKEATRQQGKLASGLNLQAAQQKLDFPLRRQAFQEQLRQQAFQNRLALTGTAGQLNLGTASAFNPLQLQSLFLSERLGQPTDVGKSTTRASQLGFEADFANLFKPPTG